MKISEWTCAICQKKLPVPSLARECEQKHEVTNERWWIQPKNGAQDSSSTKSKAEEGEHQSKPKLRSVA